MADSPHVSGIVPLGEVLALSGVKTRITANRTSPAQGYKAHGFVLIARPSNTGRVDVYRGNAAGSAFEYIGYLPIPTVNTAPAFTIALTAAAASVQLNDVYIAPTVSNDGVIVTALVA